MYQDIAASAFNHAFILCVIGQFISWKMTMHIWRKEHEQLLKLWLKKDE